MYLIVGLGNPEPEYSKTRHNMGFDVINKLSNKYEINVNKSKWKGLVGTGIIENEKTVSYTHLIIAFLKFNIVNTFFTVSTRLWNPFFLLLKEKDFFISFPFGRKMCIRDSN